MSTVKRLNDVAKRSRELRRDIERIADDVKTLVDRENARTVERPMDDGEEGRPRTGDHENGH